MCQCVRACLCVHTCVKLVCVCMKIGGMGKGRWKERDSHGVSGLFSRERNNTEEPAAKCDYVLVRYAADITST